MESRNLGNKTKIIKLMSSVGNCGLIILTPPLNPEFMSKYHKTIGPRNKDYSPFTYCLSIEPRKEAKTQWENPPLNMDRNFFFGNLVINHTSPHDQQSPTVI